MAQPCVCALCVCDLIEVWQETLRAKFRTKNCPSAFLSIFDCTNVNYSVFTRFACIFVENNHHENIGKHHARIRRRHCGLMTLREGGMWTTVCTLVDCENQRCRPNGHWVCVSVQVATTAVQKNASILGGGFLLVISYHTWYKIAAVFFVQCSMQSAYKSFDGPCDCK